MDRNKSDILTSYNIKTWLNNLGYALNLADINHDKAKEKARHTLICSSNRPVVWLEYGNSKLGLCETEECTLHLRRLRVALCA